MGQIKKKSDGRRDLIPGSPPEAYLIEQTSSVRSHTSNCLPNKKSKPETAVFRGISKTATSFQDFKKVITKVVSQVVLLLNTSFEQTAPGKFDK